MQKKVSAWLNPSRPPHLGSCVIVINASVTSHIVTYELTNHRLIIEMGSRAERACNSGNFATCIENNNILCLITEMSDKAILKSTQAPPLACILLVCAVARILLDLLKPCIGYARICHELKSSDFSGIGQKLALTPIRHHVIRQSIRTIAVGEKCGKL